MLGATSLLRSEDSRPVARGPTVIEYAQDVPEQPLADDVTTQPLDKDELHNLVDATRAHGNQRSTTEIASVQLSVLREDCRDPLTNADDFTEEDDGIPITIDL